MIYSHVLDSFNLYSQWDCYLSMTSPGIFSWVIKTQPSVDSKSLQFIIDLPVDAVIHRAWLSVSLGYPSSGAAYVHLNGKSIPSSGIVELEGITSLTTQFQANFSYKANAVVYTDENTHTATMSFGTPTLNVEYTSSSEETPDIDENAPGDIVRSSDSGLQLPRLLDANLSEVTRISPAKVSLDLQLDPLSTAIMDIPYGQPSVDVRDFLELFSISGSAGIYRVSKIETQVGMVTKAWLKHAFVTLEDDIAISVPAIEGTFREVVSSLLDAQSVRRWVVGDVDLPDEYKVLYSAGKKSIRASIMDIFDKLPSGYYLDLDTLQYPWRINLRALPADDFCEGRLHRNLAGVKITRDDRDLCTRVFPYGAGEGDDRINLSSLTGALYMDADTAGQWGLVVKTFAEDTVFDAITLQDVAQLYLDINKNPLLSVDLDAVNLENITGENIDRFYPGRLCRLSLPDYGITMNERVVSINYPDVYGNPNKADVVLANKVRDSFDDLANLVREASASKLIGGTVSTEEVKSSAGNIASNSPKTSHFDINTYGNLLSVKVRYNTSPSVKCRVRVDGTNIDGAENMAQPIDILRYLKTDENGIPTVGEHYAEFSPVASSSESFWVHTTIILKTIEKQ